MSRLVGDSSEVDLQKMARTNPNVEQGDSNTLLATCRDMFQFEQVQA